MGSKAATTSAPAVVGDLGECFRVFDAAEEVRLLDDDARRRIVDRGRQLLRLQDAARRADRHHFDAEVFEIRGNRQPILGMQARRHDNFAKPTGGARRHQHRLGRGAAAVVEAGVRDVEAGEPGDQRLVLEHDLEIALADLGLVGRVGSVEFASAGDLVDHRRHEVVVAAAAEEADLVRRVGVFGRERRHVLRELDLSERRRDRQLALQTQVGGDHCEEIFD